MINSIPTILSLFEDAFDIAAEKDLKKYRLISYFAEPSIPEKESSKELFTHLANDSNNFLIILQKPINLYKDRQNKKSALILSESLKEKRILQFQCDLLALMNQHLYKYINNQQGFDAFENAITSIYAEIINNKHAKMVFFLLLKQSDSLFNTLEEECLNGNFAVSKLSNSLTDLLVPLSSLFSAAPDFQQFLKEFQEHIKRFDYFYELLQSNSQILNYRSLCQEIIQKYFDKVSRPTGENKNWNKMLDVLNTDKTKILKKIAEADDTKLRLSLKKIKDKANNEGKDGLENLMRLLLSLPPQYLMPTLYAPRADINNNNNNRHHNSEERRSRVVYL